MQELLRKHFFRRYAVPPSHDEANATCCSEDMSLSFSVTEEDMFRNSRMIDARIGHPKMSRSHLLATVTKRSVSLRSGRRFT